MEAEASQDEEDDQSDGDSQHQETDDMFEADFVNDTTPGRGSQIPRG